MPVERPVRRRREEAVDLLDRRRPRDLEDAVGERCVEQRHADREAVELALQLGKIRPIAVAEPVVVGISDRLAARARRRSLCGASTIVWVLVRSWSVVIEPRLDPDPLVDDLDDRREAVRRARGRGEDVVAVGVVEVVVDADDDVERAPSFTGAATMTLFTPRSKYGPKRLEACGTCRCTRARCRRRARPRAHRGGSRARPSSRSAAPSISSSSPSPSASRSQRPWTESNSSRWAAVAGSPASSLMRTKSRSVPVPSRAQREPAHPPEAVDGDPRAHTRSPDGINSPRSRSTLASRSSRMARTSSRLLPSGSSRLQSS